MEPSEAVQLAYLVQFIAAVGVLAYLAHYIGTHDGPHRATLAFVFLLGSVAAERAFRIYQRIQMESTGKLDVASWDWLIWQVPLVVAMLAVLFVFVDFD